MNGMESRIRIEAYRFFALSTLFIDVRVVSLITQEGKELVGKATPLTHHLTSIASILSFPVSLLLSYLFYPLALSMFPWSFNLALILSLPLPSTCPSSPLLCPFHFHCLHLLQ